MRGGDGGIGAGRRCGAQQGKDLGGGGPRHVLSVAILAYRSLCKFAQNNRTRLPRITGLAQANRTRQCSPGSPTMEFIMGLMSTMSFAERLKYEPAAVMGTMKANVRVRVEKIRLRWIEEYQSENCWDVYASDDTDHAKLWQWPG